MPIGFKKVERTFDPATGEKLKFVISNNGNKKWQNVDEETRKEALEFMDTCIEDIKRMRQELESIKP